MSDFEADPAADFIAREQEDLANLEDDDFSYLAHNRTDNVPQNFQSESGPGKSNILNL